MHVRLASEASLLCKGLHDLLESHPEIMLVESVVCKQCCDQYCCDSHDVVIIDISNGRIGSLDCIRKMLARFPHSKVLALINIEHVSLLGDIFDRGALGVVSLDADASVLVEAVKRIASGGGYVEAALAQALTEIPYKKSSKIFDCLTKCETSVLLSILNGQSHDRCASSLNISKKTVANHYSRIKSKLKIDNSVQLTRLAMLHKIIETT